MGSAAFYHPLLLLPCQAPSTADWPAAPGQLPHPAGFLLWSGCGHALVCQQYLLTCLCRCTGESTAPAYTLGLQLLQVAAAAYCSVHTCIPAQRRCSHRHNKLSSLSERAVPVRAPLMASPTCLRMQLSSAELRLPLHPCHANTASGWPKSPLSRRPPFFRVLRVQPPNSSQA
jgi:hypothetical protein